MLALTIHVDQEPFNFRNAPLMCRNYDEGQQQEPKPAPNPAGNRSRGRLKTSAFTMAPNRVRLEEEMSKLIAHILNYLSNQVIPSFLFHG
jgi:hypothetical protein